MQKLISKQQQKIVKESQQQRWDAVILGNLMLSGAFYCMQEVPTIHNYLRVYFVNQGIVNYKFDQYINISQSCSLGILIFFTLVIGALSDKYKPGIILIVQTLLILVSQFLNYLSIYCDNFWFLFIGRMVIFVQASSMFISTKVFVNNFSSDQFKGLSLGIMMTSITFFGLNLLIEPYLVDNYGLLVSLFITFIVACISFMISVICFYIEDQNLETEQLSSEQETIYSSDIEERGVIIQQDNSQSDQSYYVEMKNLDKAYWIFCPTMFLSTVVSTVIEVTGPMMITHQWGYDTNYSTAINSIVQIMGTLVPFLGYVSDKLNKDYEWVTVACSCQLIGVIIIGFYSPLYGYIIFGMGYSLRLAIYGPLITKLVPKQNVGKAIGLIRSLKDLTGMFVFIFISISIEKTHSYELSIKLLIIMCSLVLFFSIQLQAYNKTKLT